MVWMILLVSRWAAITGGSAASPNLAASISDPASSLVSAIIRVQVLLTLEQGGCEKNEGMRELLGASDSGERGTPVMRRDLISAPPQISQVNIMGGGRSKLDLQDFEGKLS